MSQFFTSGGQSIEISTSTSVLLMNIQDWFNEYSRLISFRIDWFDLLAVQGTLKSLLQHPQFKNISSLPLSFLCSPTSPRQPLIYLLFLWIYLSQTFHISQIRQHVVYWMWLLSWSIMLLSFIHVVACISTSFLFMVNNIPLFIDKPQLIYPFITWWTFGLFSFLRSFK